MEPFDNDGHGCGSSPLTRGKHPRRPHRGQGHRLIPAHAGKTRYAGRFLYRHAAHPRSRGENRCEDTRFLKVAGSSPLTRGKPNPTHDARNRSRLIPAHAGKTSGALAGCPAARAHPRSRGENLAWAVEGARGYGSSPLTRGKRLVNGESAQLPRLIPAHAGKTG